MVDGHEPVDAVTVGAHDVLRLAPQELAARPDADPLVMAQGVQSAVDGALQFAKQLFENVGGLQERAVGAARGLPGRRGAVPAVGLREQPDQGLVRQVQDLLQRADGAQRLGSLRTPCALLPVAQARHAHLDPVTRQVVLDALQRQSTGGDSGTQRHVEGAAPQSRLKFRRGGGVDGGVRVLCGVRHAGAFL